MSNELKIFKNEEFGQVKDVENANKNKYIGFFYYLEWDNFVKIGCTKNPYERVMALKRLAKYGDITIGRYAISKGHTNYVENESKLHRYYKDYRKEGTELFNVEFDNIIQHIPNTIIFKDETINKEKDENIVLNYMKSFILTNYKSNTNDFDKELFEELIKNPDIIINYLKGLNKINKEIEQ